MLTNDEIKMLSDGLDALLSKYLTEAMMAGMFVGILTPDKDAREKLFNEQIDKAKSQRAEIEDRIILLKAKLVQMRDKNIVESIIAESIGT